MNPPAVTESDLAAVARAFQLLGHFQSGAPYGSGHINDTFAVTIDQAGTGVRYILQRINQRVFKDVPALMRNIQRVTAWVGRRAAETTNNDVARRSLTLVPAPAGQAFHRDASGGLWRCYLFIEGARAHDIIESPAQAREAARAFGVFQQCLVDLPGERLHETIPFFHHTRRRFDVLRRAIVTDSRRRAAGVQDLIAFALERESTVDTLVDLQARGTIPERITHNDTKLNNVMLDDVTGAGICVIDLDTVMPGLALHDFGDMVRTATNSAAEDETDLAKVEARLDIFEALAEGYLSTAGGFLNDTERKQLVFSGRLMTFENGIRFLTDYLEGDAYFKIKHPGHNLDRARNQFALLRSMESRAGAMEAMVENCLAQ